MALGLPHLPFTVEDCWDGYCTAFGWSEPLCTCIKKQMTTVDYVWTGQELVNEICKARRITRERFIRSMAAPKPSHIQHLIFNDELQKLGHEPLPNWPQGRGLIIPKWEGRTITAIHFHSLREILKPGEIKQAA